MSVNAPLDQLREEHAAATVGLRGLQADSDKLPASATTRWDETGLSVQAKFTAFSDELLRHFKHEEDAVFPVVIALAAEGAPAVDILTQFFSGETDEDLKAHTIMRSRLRELREVLEQGASAGELKQEAVGRLQSLLRLTADILARHIAKEHAVVFPMIERLLDNAQMEEVARKLASLDDSAA